MERALQLGIDLGGTNVRAALVDNEGQICELVKERTCHAGSRALAAQVAAMGRGLLERYPAQAVGICAPGVFLSDGTLQHATNLPEGMEQLKLLDQLGEAFGLPVFGENDANAAALGEYVFGSGRGAKSMYYVTISTGIGGGFIWDGHIIRGAHGFAGEVGSVWVTEKSEAFRALAPGAVEGWSAGDAVLERGRAKIDPALSDAGEVFELARNGNSAAAQLVEEMAAGLARMFADITCVVNPEVFVLGGGCMKSADCFMDRMLSVYRSLLPKFLWDTRFVRAKLEEPGLLGCAAIAKNGLSEGGRIAPLDGENR